MGKDKQNNKATSPQANMSQSDFADWLDVELWRVHEAVSILLELKPVTTTVNHPSQVISAIKEESTRVRWEKLYAATKNAMKLESLEWLPPHMGALYLNRLVKPFVFATWAHSRGFELPVPVARAFKVVVSDGCASQVLQAADTLLEIEISPRPLVIDAALLALDPHVFVKYSKKIGKTKTSGQIRAKELIAEIKAQITRQAEGFFTVEEAAQVLADSRGGMNAAKLIDQMKAAFTSTNEPGKLFIRDFEHRIPHFRVSDVWDSRSLVKVSDIDDWLAGLRAGYCFPKHNKAGPARETDSNSSRPGTPSSNIVHSTKPKRRNVLTSVIEHAQSNCRNPQDASEVWAQLIVLAEKKAAPLIGVTEGGLQYLKDGTADFLTREALGKRLNRQTRPHAAGERR